MGKETFHGLLICWKFDICFDDDGGGGGDGGGGDGDGDDDDDDW
jgi:hypothetical protein